jgi:FkbM family methyltransferase
MKPHYHQNDFIFFVRQRSSDIPIIKEVVAKDCYGVLENIKPHDVVLDIGGHIGTFSVFAASRGSNVITYEAVQRNFDLLKENIEINGFPVKINKMAVAGKNETRTIYIRNFNFGGSNLYSPHADENFKEQVECITLDKVFETNNIKECHFLKLDCEGAELEILENFSDLTKLKYIAMEYHGDQRREDLIKLLSKTHEVTLQGENPDAMDFMTARLK